MLRLPEVYAVLSEPAPSFIIAHNGKWYNYLVALINLLAAVKI